MATENHRVFRDYDPITGWPKEKVVSPVTDGAIHPHDCGALIYGDEPCGTCEIERQRNEKFSTKRKKK